MAIKVFALACACLLFTSISGLHFPRRDRNLSQVDNETIVQNVQTKLETATVGGPLGTLAEIIESQITEPADTPS